MGEVHINSEGQQEWQEIGQDGTVVPDSMCREER